MDRHRVNTYVKHFLQADMLSSMAVGDVLSEVTVGKSRLDFKIGKNSFLEIKMPLNSLVTPDHIKQLTPLKRQVATFARLIKHFNELGDTLNNTNTGTITSPNGTNKAVIALVFMYDAPPFVP